MSNIANIDDLVKSSIKNIEGSNILPPNKLEIDCKGVSVEVIDSSFNWNEPIPINPDSLYQNTFVNNSPTEDIIHFSDEKDESDTFTWSVTEGIKFSLSMTAKEGFNIAGESAELSYTFGMEANLSATQTGSKSEMRKWSAIVDIKNPPYYNTEVTWMLNRSKCQGTVTIKLKLSGLVVYTIDSGDSTHVATKQVAITIGPILGRSDNLPKSFILEGDNAYFMGTLNINSQEGFKSIVNKKSTPLQKLTEGKTFITEYTFAQNGEIINEINSEQ